MTPTRHAIRVRIGAAGMPFFAECPYFLWGEVNYDSEGDCRRPTDRSWTELDLTNRRTEERVSVLPASPDPTDQRRVIEGDNADSVRLLAYLVALRTGGQIVDPATGAEIRPGRFAQTLGDLTARHAAAERIRSMFLNPALAPFDSHAWWGGWKWTGTFSTNAASGLRLTMLAVEQGRAEPDVLGSLHDWWQREPHPLHRAGVRYALQALTGTDPGGPPDTRDE